MSNGMRYQVNLDAEERKDLLEMVKRGYHNAREIRRANTLLQLDKDEGRQEIAEVLHIHPATVTATARTYCEEGLRGALFDKHRSGAPPKIGSAEEARITAIACSKPPEGRDCWTLALIRDQFLVMVEHIDELSTETIRRVLKKK